MYEWAYRVSGVLPPTASRNRSMRLTAPSAMASARGCSRVVRRWSLALPAAATAQMAESLPASITPLTTSL